MAVAATATVVGPRAFHSKKQGKWTRVLGVFVAVSVVGQGILFFALERREHSFSQGSSRIQTTTSWSNRRYGAVSTSPPDGHHRGPINKDRARIINSTAASMYTDLAYPEDDFNKNHVDIVFTTDCSGYQHWQGILLYYSAQRVNHTGKITRIASGCTLEEDGIETRMAKDRSHWIQISNSLCTNICPHEWKVQV
jgi:hypothetical protein